MSFNSLFVDIFFRTEIDKNEQLCFSFPEELKGPIHNTYSKVSHVTFSNKQINMYLCIHTSCISISPSYIHSFVVMHPFAQVILWIDSSVLCIHSHLFYCRRLPKTIENLLSFLLLKLNSSVEFAK